VSDGGVTAVQLRWPHDTARLRGTLRGHLWMVGGPRGHLPARVPGKVVIDGSGGHFETIAGPEGSYALALPPGTYELTATSAKYWINGEVGVGRAAEPASIAPGRETVADVYFLMK